jgi:hypothetical protein
MGFRNEDTAKNPASNHVRSGSHSPSTPSVSSEGKATVVATPKGTGRRGVPTAKALAGK